ncbi:ABC transporter permease [Streptomyces sp. JH002]|uniref:Transport permease protein n=1 Tax=Streptomyces xiamenensis TaxID=408015 RepID=A0A0F7FQW4_9ACTN|nr:MULTISPECIES: ABC transporter permease [Streptomyces]AKG42545.1 ABC transporter permease [Streptomyces xiamenensis]
MSATTTQARPEPRPEPVPAGERQSDDGRIGARANLRHISALIRRNALQIKQNPESMADALLMPIVMTLLFVYVFGGAIAGEAGGYPNWIVPGLMAMMGLSLAMSVGTGVHEDFSKGVMDRFRSMPIARSSVLIAKVIVELGRLLVTMAVLLVVGLAVGLELNGRWVELLAAVGLAALFGASLTWIFILLGLTMRSAQAIQGMAFMVMMPLQFGSSIFVPTETMPGWLQAFANVNPLSQLAEASRNLINGAGDVAGPAASVVLWSVAITLVTAPLAISKFRKKV